jgi:hypothetical protein
MSSNNKLSSNKPTMSTISPILVKFLDQILVPLDINETDLPLISFEGLYRATYEMVLKKKGEELLNYLTGKVRQYVENEATVINNLDLSVDDVTFIKTTSHICWRIHKKMQMIGNACMYLDRVVVQPKTKEEDVVKTLREIFWEIYSPLILTPIIRQRVTDCLKRIHEKNNDNLIDKKNYIAIITFIDKPRDKSHNKDDNISTSTDNNAVLLEMVMNKLKTN